MQYKTLQRQLKLAKELGLDVKTKLNSTKSILQSEWIRLFDVNLVEFYYNEKEIRFYDNWNLKYSRIINKDGTTWIH